MRLTAVFFDLDGTLIDSSAGIESSARKAVEQVLPGVHLPSLRPFIGPPVREVFAAALGKDPGDPILTELERHFRIDYNQFGFRLSVLNEGAVAALDDLAHRGISCFVVTNKPAIPTAAILAELQLSGRFNEVICRDSRKPPFNSKGDCVAHLLQTHQLSADAVVLVGDTKDDADAARQNGIRFVAALFGYGFSADVPDEACGSISSLTELRNVCATDTPK